MEIWAHRGASAIAPENTMVAFVKAHEAGADAIELDVHRTADGVLVVIHDDTVVRTTEGRGYVQAASFLDLRALDAGYKFGMKFRGEKIPSLDEVLDFAHFANLLVNIELKNARIPYAGLEAQVIKALEAHRMVDRAVLSSFNHRSMTLTKKSHRSVRVAFLTLAHRPLSPAYVRAMGVNAVHPNAKTVGPVYMREALAAQIAVRPYAVDDEILVKTFDTWGVDAVITDHPHLAKRVLNNLK